jgi:iron complex outermembrane recepter protein
VPPDEKPASHVEEIVVTAQKRAENVQNVPISISVVSGSSLDKASIVGVTEALNLVPGVVATVANQGGGTQIAMRGVGAAAPILKGSSPIGYYLDSVPFGLVKQAIAPDPDSYDLQRIEVVRGPQGTLYGANAQGGLVRVLTNEANLDQLEAKGRAFYSQTDRGGDNYRGDLAVNVPLIEGKLAARAVVGYQSMSGWVDGPVGRDINDGTAQNYRLKVNGAPTQRLSLGLSAWASRDDRGAPSVSGDDGRSLALIPQPISTDYDAYGFKLGYDFPLASLSSTTSYLDYANEGTLDTGGGVPLLTRFHSHMFAQEINLTSNLDGAWRWSAGLFYRDATDRRIQSIPATYGADWSDGSESHAIYAELSQRFAADRLEWTLGLRYVHDEVLNKQNSPDLGQPAGPLSNVTHEFNATTPRAVLSWFPGEALTMYASYSEGFRSGAPQDPGVARAFPAFPPLKPDELKNYEIGAKGSLRGGRLVFDAAAYYIDWQDVQQTLSVPFGPDGLFVAAYANGESASGPGFDFGVTTRPIDSLSLGVNFSWNDLVLDADLFSRGVLLFNKGDRLNFSSETTVGAHTDYVFPLGGSGLQGRLAASASYSSKQHDHILIGTTRITNLGDSILIGRMSFAVSAQERWSALAFVDNINNDYTGNPSASTVPQWAPRARPRTIGLQLDYRF